MIKNEKVTKIKIFAIISEAYLEPCQISKIECFAEKVNDF